jgi:hypothetical protein
LTSLSIYVILQTSKGYGLVTEALRNPEVIRIKMQHITLSKIAGESYKPYSFKTYEARRNGEVVGSVAQDYSGKWEVVTLDFNLISTHTTIKAAVRVAGRVL